jgi:FlaA1/EpsC-like NDP-sugar epimerase
VTTRLKYTLRGYLTRLSLVLTDVILSMVSFLTAAWLRYNFDFDQALDYFLSDVFLVLIVRVVSFRIFRPYAMNLRFVSLSTVVTVFNTVVSAGLLMFLAGIFMRYYGISVSLSVLVIDSMLLTILMSAYRLAIPIFLSRSRGVTAGSGERIIVLGAGYLGMLTKQILERDPNTRRQVIAFIDDNPDLVNTNVDGAPVYRASRLSSLVADKAVLAIRNISPERQAELFDLCIEKGIPILRVPLVQNNHLVDDFSAADLQEIRIEDLLHRPAIHLPEDELKRTYSGRRILITGGAGSIGSEIVRQLIPLKPSRLIILDQSESALAELQLECHEHYKAPFVTAVLGDVCDHLKLTDLFEQYRPEVIFHAAAYKHVPMVEHFPEEGVKVNVLGTRALAQMATQYNAEKFVMVSTDKAVNPTNVMGATKRVAELLIQSLDTISQTSFITTRFGNVLGSNGSVVPRFREQIRQGGPLTVTHPDITRYFMTISEASRLVLEAGAMGEGGEIYLFDMGQPVKILDLAEKMIKLAGRRPYQEIDIIFSGLRPGEKLIEELLIKSEETLETHNPKIMKARVSAPPYHKVERLVNQLVDLLGASDQKALVGQLKTILPEFVSQNSEFEVLDRETKE